MPETTTDTPAGYHRDEHGVLWHDNCTCGGKIGAPCPICNPSAPKRYRDRHGDTWQQMLDGRLALMTGPGHGPEGGPLSTICVYTRSEVERVDGPLTEIKAATR